MLTNKAVSLVTFEHRPIISECQQTTNHEKKKKKTSASLRLLALPMQNK